MTYGRPGPRSPLWPTTPVPSTWRYGNSMALADITGEWGGIEREARVGLLGPANAGLVFARQGRILAWTGDWTGSIDAYRPAIEPLMREGLQGDVRACLESLLRGADDISAHQRAGRDQSPDDDGRGGTTESGRVEQCAGPQAASARLSPWRRVASGPRGIAAIPVGGSDLRSPRGRIASTAAPRRSVCTRGRTWPETQHRRDEEAGTAAYRATERYRQTFGDQGFTQYLQGGPRPVDR